MLTHDLHTAFAQQFVVVEQTACDGVLNGDESYYVGVLLHFLKHLFERVATNDFDRLVVEKLMGGDVVKTSNNSLYGYSSHCDDGQKNNPTRLGAGLLCFFFSSYLWSYIHIHLPALL